jgi:homoserine O-acetyltransferase
MTVLAYCALFPDEVDHLVTISGAASAAPFAIALRSLQREMVRGDPAWRGGNYEPGRGPRLGMRLARKLGTITYRSAAEWNERFGRRRVPETAGLSGDFRPQFEVEAYLEHQALRFADSFDANAYLYLSRAMDQFDLAEHGDGSLSAAFAKFGPRRALVIGVETDLLFPIDQQREIAEHLRVPGRDVEFHAFPSLQGHDAFLVDLARFEPAIGGFLAGVTTSRV